jgi:hypothetical protein
VKSIDHITFDSEIEKAIVYGIATWLDEAFAKWWRGNLRLRIEKRVGL